MSRVNILLEYFKILLDILVDKFIEGGRKMKHTKIIIGIVIVLIISIPAFLYFNYSDKSLIKNTSSTSTSGSNDTDTNVSNNSSNSNGSKNNSSNKKTEPTTTDSEASTTGSSASTVTANMTYLSLNDFASSLSCVNYTIKEGDTLTSICSKYYTYCNLNTSINLVTLINNITNPEELTIGNTLKIPESTFVSGTLYKIKEGDSWYKIRDTYYKNYDIDNFMNFIIDLNELPNNVLPLGETIFLPALSV